MLKHYLVCGTAYGPHDFEAVVFATNEDNAKRIAEEHEDVLMVESVEEVKPTNSGQVLYLTLTEEKCPDPD